MNLIIVAQFDGREALCKAQFRYQTFHEPNLIQTWTYSNNVPVESDIKIKLQNFIKFEPKHIER